MPVVQGMMWEAFTLQRRTALFILELCMAPEMGIGNDTLPKSRSVGKERNKKKRNRKKKKTANVTSSNGGEIGSVSLESWLSQEAFFPLPPTHMTINSGAKISFPE